MNELYSKNQLTLVQQASMVVVCFYNQNSFPPFSSIKSQNY